MARKLIALGILLLSSSNTSAQTLFEGRKVTITEPETDADGFFPKGPASVCIEGLVQRQCYTAPEAFGRAPEVTVVQVMKNLPALFFSVFSGGVS